MGPSYNPTTGMWSLSSRVRRRCSDYWPSTPPLRSWSRLASRPCGRSRNSSRTMLVDLCEVSLNRSAQQSWPVRPTLIGGEPTYRSLTPGHGRWCRALIDRRMIIGDFRPPNVIRLGPAPLYTRFVDVFDAVQRMAEVLQAGVEDLSDRPRVT